MSRKVLIVGGIAVALIVFVLYRSRFKSVATAARDEQANGVPANGLAAIRRPVAMTNLVASLSPNPRNKVAGATVAVGKSNIGSFFGKKSA